MSRPTHRILILGAGVPTKPRNVKHELVIDFYNSHNNGDERGWMHLDQAERFTTWKNSRAFRLPAP